MGPVTGELLPIDVVARRLGLRASAIRYYEERGLIEPASRRGGRRWYGPAGVRRLAVIRFWQTAGLMGLDEIAELLDGPDAPRDWDRVVDDRIAALRDQIDGLRTACELLEHVREHHRSTPDGCPHYEELLRGLSGG